MNTVQNEHGRSMVEMLGVLAIIGVLSIGGIQGYTYAMNKYRANNVLNEINMASHQLAMELLTSRNAQKMLSLGNPYDNGTMITENYPFDYGCGNYDSKERACHQKEKGYWMSVGGLTEKVCQNMLAEAGFLPYFVLPKLNGEIVTAGINCAENDNQIMFLFNSDETGEQAELPEKCSTNADCSGSEYCDITDYGSNNCTKDTIHMTGFCRKVSKDIRKPNVGTNPPFIVSSRGMMWWSAKNFCQALGTTLVSVSDYGCAHSICSKGCDAIKGYCHADTSTPVGSVDSSNISVISQVMKAAYGGSYGWTNTDYNSCISYGLYLGGIVNFNYRTNNAGIAVCK